MAQRPAIDFRQVRVSDEWMKKEGIPIYRALYGVEDITELPRGPWARMGGKGTFIELEPTWEVGKMVYVAEIPSGGALNPEKHLYNETLYVLRGRGLAEVWQPGESKRSFEFGDGSLFVMPTNLWHRLVNGGREPVLILAQTNAPVLMEAFRDTEFIFNCDYKFGNHYSGQADFFAAGKRRESDPRGYEMRMNQWYTNFIPDVRTAMLDNAFGKVSGGQLTFFRTATGDGGHASEWPQGRYHTAHYHVGGAILLGLKGEGYVLLWHRRYGIHPYQDGHADKVVKVDWKVNGIYSPGTAVFHQHFSTAKEPARQLRWVAGGSTFAFVRPRAEERVQTGSSVREGGSLINYEDEDPEIRRMIEAALAKKDIKCTMPPVTYRTDPFKLPYEGEGRMPGDGG